MPEREEVRRFAQPTLASQTEQASKTENLTQIPQFCATTTEQILTFPRTFCPKPPPHPATGQPLRRVVLHHGHEMFHHSHVMLHHRHEKLHHRAVMLHHRHEKLHHRPVMPRHRHEKLHLMPAMPRHGHGKLHLMAGMEGRRGGRRGNRPSSQFHPPNKRNPKANGPSPKANGQKAKPSQRKPKAHERLSKRGCRGGSPCAREAMRTLAGEDAMPVPPAGQLTAASGPTFEAVLRS